MLHLAASQRVAHVLHAAIGFLVLNRLVGVLPQVMCVLLVPVYLDGFHQTTDADVEEICNVA